MDQRRGLESISLNMCFAYCIILFGNDNYSTHHNPVVQTGRCMTNPEFEDPDLGSFEMNRTLYCNPACGEYIRT